MTAVQLKRKLRNFPVAKLQQKITTGWGRHPRQATPARGLSREPGRCGGRGPRHAPRSRATRRCS